MLGDHFPRTRDSHPELVDWKQPFDWSTQLAFNTLLELLEAQIAKADQSLTALMAISMALRDDLADATAQADNGAQAANVDVVRFLASLPVATSAVIEGDFGLAYDWVLGGISRDFKSDHHSNTVVYTPPPYSLADPTADAYAFANLTRYYSAFYTVALKLGGIDVLAEKFAAGATSLAMAELGGSGRERAVKLLAVLGQWAAERGRPQAPWFAGQLSSMLLSAAFTPRERVMLGIALSGALATYSGRSANAWAKYLLEQCADALVEHEPVQLYALAIDSKEGWSANRASILAEIQKLANFYREHSREGGDAGVSLESRIPILHPLFYSLATFGSTDDVMDVLWAWYGRPGSDCADADILFVCPAYGDGTAYVWPGGRSLPTGSDPANLDRFLTTLSLTQSQFFRGPAGDRVFEVEEGCWGRLNHDHADNLRRDMATLYDFVRLRRMIPENWQPRSIVVVPSHRDPAQAELSEALGWLAPLEASVAVVRPSRSRRLMRVWRDDGVQLVDAEIEILRSLGSLGGWDVDVCDEERTAANFRRFYEDAEPDLVWVIGHGEMDAHHIGQTGLVLGDGLILPVREMAAYALPEGDRRLLVLNICSGGAAQNRGGLGHLGLAQSLAGPHQSVVAHQWPVDYYPALAFAAAFMLGLIDGEARAALKFASVTMRDVEQVRRRLSEIDPSLSAIERLNTPAACENAESVLNWGNAALYT